MADIEKLVSMLKKLDVLPTGCMRCGMCQAQCLVFAQTGRETDVTRGKLALLSGLADEMLKAPQARRRIAATSSPACMLQLADMP